MPMGVLIGRIVLVLPKGSSSRGEVALDEAEPRHRCHRGSRGGDRTRKVGTVSSLALFLEGSVYTVTEGLYLSQRQNDAPDSPFLFLDSPRALSVYHRFASHPGFCDPRVLPLLPSLPDSQTSFDPPTCSHHYSLRLRSVATEERCDGRRQFCGAKQLRPKTLCYPGCRRKVGADTPRELVTYDVGFSSIFADGKGKQRG